MLWLLLVALCCLSLRALSRLRESGLDSNDCVSNVHPCKTKMLKIAAWDCALVNPTFARSDAEAQHDQPNRSCLSYCKRCRFDGLAPTSDCGSGEVAGAVDAEADELELESVSAAAAAAAALPRARRAETRVGAGAGLTAEADAV